MYNKSKIVVQTYNKLSIHVKKNEMGNSLLPFSFQEKWLGYIEIQ